MTRRTFLVTGASRGIGFAVAQRLHAAGHRVIGLARTPPSGEFPGEFHPCNLRDGRATEQLFSELVAHEAVDGIVNNVGYGVEQPIHELTLPMFWEVMTINLQAAILGAKLFTPGMKDRRFGRIVNIASTAVLGAPRRSYYGAAKAALLSFTRSWATELAPAGITVNAVAPGNTTTEGFRRNCPESSDLERKHASRVPLGRLAAPDEVAWAVQFFLAEESGYITGQTLFVDGGVSVRR